MKRTVLSLIALAGLQAQAGPGPGTAFATHSASGQFVVPPTHVAPPAALPLNSPAARDYLELDPTLLAVTAGRVRQALCEDTGLPAAWHDKIYLTLRSVRSADDTAAILSERFRDGWVYRLELPSVMARRQFIRALVNVILLEHCNRNAGDHSTEIPAWLSEGLTQHLLATRENELLLPPPQLSTHGIKFQPVIGRLRKGDPLATARETLRSHRTLTLEQLSWPTPEQLSGADEGVYFSSAQFFLRELLGLPEGRRCFGELLELLPQYYNWQTAFFRAYRSHFQQSLDLEKWWSLQLAHFIGRDPGEVWTATESCEKLDQLLQASVAVRRSPRELPTRVAVPLQNVLRDWDYSQQKEILIAKLNELEIARFRLAPPLTALADEYRAVIRDYLNRRESPLVGFSANRSPLFPAREIVREFTAKLDALDGRRAALRAELAAAAAGGASSNSARNRQ